MRFPTIQYKWLLTLCLLFMFSACAKTTGDLEHMILPEGESWTLGYKNQNDQMRMFQYVRTTETIHTWQDLITVSEVYLPLQTPMSQAMTTAIQALKQSCPYEVVTQPIQEDPNNLLYTYSIQDTTTIWEQSYARILRGKKHLWFFQYTTKKTPIPDVRQAVIQKYLRSIRWNQ